MEGDASWKLVHGMATGLPIHLSTAPDGKHRRPSQMTHSNGTMAKTLDPDHFQANDPVVDVVQ